MSDYSYKPKSFKITNSMDGAIELLRESFAVIIVDDDNLNTGYHYEVVSDFNSEDKPGYYLIYSLIGYVPLDDEEEEHDIFVPAPIHQTKTFLSVSHSSALEKLTETLLTKLLYNNSTA